jgi:hypothetical protein
MTSTGPDVCDLILRNGAVVTLDAQRRVIDRGAIAIAGNSILAVGPETDVLAQYRAGRVLDAGGGIVHPGFIILIGLRAVLRPCTRQYGSHCDPRYYATWACCRGVLYPSFLR